MSDKTGGPAFPSPYILPEHQGMTLLDYFAGQAMQICTLTDHKNAAGWCYDRAAAMIKEREKRK